MNSSDKHKVMNTYLVELISDFDEQVSLYIEAEAETIGVTMLEKGELNCAGQICAVATVVLV